MKKIEIIPLAQRKADKRGIKTEWIEDAFSHPEQVVDGYGGRKVIHKRLFIEEKEYLHFTNKTLLEGGLNENRI